MALTPVTPALAQTAPDTSPPQLVSGSPAAPVAPVLSTGSTPVIEDTPFSISVETAPNTQLDVLGYHGDDQPIYLTSITSNDEGRVTATLRQGPLLTALQVVVAGT